MNTDQPRFEDRIEVTQVSGGGSSLGGMLLLSLLFAAPFFYLCVHLGGDDLESVGFWAGLGMLGCMLLGLVAMFVGFIVWLAIESKWASWRGTTPFHATAFVTMDAAGLNVEGLGFAGWEDILELEGIPDSDSMFIVHTRAWKRLMLKASVEQVCPVLRHHMALFAERQRLEQGSGKFTFKAVVFRWHAFFAWIAAGYVLALAAAILILTLSERGFLGTLLGAGLLAVMAAWLVWAIPLSQVSLFAPKRVRAFELDAVQRVLRSTDGRWCIELEAARWDVCRRTGIGYTLDFVSFRPRRGRRLDLLMDLADISSLTERLGK